MPFYNIEHSFPLDAKHKAQLAEKITYLHSRAFTTPSIFVQVKFYSNDASSRDHFVGGTIQESANNRIIAYVRSSPSRTQEQFDKLAEQIENAWYVVLGERSEEEEEGQNGEKKSVETKGSSQVERDAKELLSIGFVPGLSGREKGFVIPTAGKETEWFKENQKSFSHKAEMGDEGFKAMLEEVEKRDDLKSWRS